MKRNTIQSSLVLETVRKLQCHATADEVYSEIIKTYPTISRGTVYRNLQRLCETGEIRKREIPDGADRFDHLCDDHYHIRCVKCGRVFDVDMEYRIWSSRSEMPTDFHLPDMILFLKAFARNVKETCRFKDCEPEDMIRCAYGSIETPRKYKYEGEQV